MPVWSRGHDPSGLPGRQQHGEPLAVAASPRRPLFDQGPVSSKCVLFSFRATSDPLFQKQICGCKCISPLPTLTPPKNNQTGCFYLPSSSFISNRVCSPLSFLRNPVSDFSCPSRKLHPRLHGLIHYQSKFLPHLSFLQKITQSPHS